MGDDFLYDSDCESEEGVVTIVHPHQHQSLPPSVVEPLPPTIKKEVIIIGNNNNDKNINATWTGYRLRNGTTRTLYNAAGNNKCCMQTAGGKRCRKSAIDPATRMCAQHKKMYEEDKNKIIDILTN